MRSVLLFILLLTGCESLSMEGLSALNKRCPDVPSADDSALLNVSNCAADIMRKNDAVGRIRAIAGAGINLNLSTVVSEQGRCSGGKCNVESSYGYARSAKGGEAESVVWRCRNCDVSGYHTETETSVMSGTTTGGNIFTPKMNDKMQTRHTAVVGGAAMRQAMDSKPSKPE